MNKIILIFIGLVGITNVYAESGKDSIAMVTNPRYEHFVLRDDDCDACGCAAGNGFSGFESLLNPQFVGLKYFAQHYLAKENLFTDKLTGSVFQYSSVMGKIPVTQNSVSTEVSLSLPQQKQCREISESAE